MTEYIWEDCPKIALNVNSARNREIAKIKLEEWIRSMEKSGYRLVLFDTELRAGFFEDLN